MKPTAPLPLTMTGITASLNNLPVDVRLKRLEALVVAGEALNRASGLNDILRTILDLLLTQLGCERATTFLLDARTDKLHAYQMAGSAPIEIVLERGVGIAGHVAECGESVLTNDVQNHPRFDRSVDKRTGFFTRSILCVPLRKADGVVVGCLQAINAPDEGFSNADQVYLESFAALAVVAVERERFAQEALRAHMLSTELEVARKIQQRLLPAPGMVALPAPYAAWGVSQSCYDVGGDAYDAVMLASGDCAFWVSDVSGKGIGAALLMTTLQTELHGLIRDESDLAKLAGELNARVHAVAGTSGTYATLFLGVLSAERSRLTYVNAGHLPPVGVVRGGVQQMAWDAGGLPVGLFPGAAYEVGSVEFKAGERLILFSDGVTEAENERGEEFDTQGVVAALSATRDETEVARLGSSVFENLNHFRMGVPAKDDTTLLLVGLS